MLLVFKPWLFFKAPITDNRPATLTHTYSVASALLPFLCVFIFQIHFNESYYSSWSSKTGELFGKKHWKKRLLRGVCAASLGFILPGCRSNTFISPGSICYVKLGIAKKQTNSVLYLFTLYLLRLLNVYLCTNCTSLIVSQFRRIYADNSLESQSLYHSSL